MLKERLAGGQLPKVYVEDLRNELKSGNRSIFSRRLYSLIADRLQKKNRRFYFSIAEVMRDSYPAELAGML